MRNELHGIYTKHYETLSLLFIVEVACVAIFLLKAVDTAGFTTFLLSLFICPLVAVWPARKGRMLRGAVTNVLIVLFLFASFMYAHSWHAWQRELSELFTALAFGMVSGMAAGGLVERWRSKQARLNPARPLPLLTTPVSLLTDDYFSSESELSYRH